VIAGLKRESGDAQSCFFMNFPAQRGFFGFTPTRYSSGQREASPIIAVNRQKFVFAIDDPDRSPQRSEEWKGPIESETGASDNPK
jgi:hypothetical protein